MPGLNACFVNVGYERDAFLHYLDLGPKFNSYTKYLKQVTSDKKKLYPFSKASILPDLEKDGSVQTTLQQGQEILVQIVKEPISTKGPRLTCELSFPGRFLVLMPFQDKVSVSSKIKSAEERARLKQLIQSIKPKNFGVIVRTVAEGKRVAELDSELKVLVKRCEDAFIKAQKASKLPELVFEETSRTVAMLRDLFNPSYENIYINDTDIFSEVKEECTEAINKFFSGIESSFRARICLSSFCSLLLTRIYPYKFSIAFPSFLLTGKTAPELDIFHLLWYWMLLPLNKQPVKKPSTDPAFCSHLPCNQALSFSVRKT